MPPIQETDGLSRIKSQSNTVEGFSKETQTTETIIEATISDARNADQTFKNGDFPNQTLKVSDHNINDSSDFMATLVIEQKKLGVAYSGSREYYKAIDKKYGKLW